MTSGSFKVMVAAGFLLGAVILAVPIRAAQQQTSQEIKQKVSKKANYLAAHATVLYNGSPRFVPIARTSISYATNTPQVVIKIGNAFYLNMEDVWLSSANAQGPWAAVHYIPEAIFEIVCTQLSVYPLDPYQLCSLPWTSGIIYSVWKPS